MKDCFNVGVIGTSFGKLAHIPAFQKNSYASIGALCGRNLENTEEVARNFEIPKIYTDYKELLENDEIDIVTVAVPPRLHCSIVLNALQKKKHVLCEKPFGVGVKEAREMASSASDAGVKHWVSHQMRFHRNFMTVKNIIASGDIGRVLHVNLSYSTSNRLDPIVPWDWWSDSRQGGGQLNAIGSHMIDLLRWWIGDIVCVSGHLLTAHKKRVDVAVNEMKHVTSDEVANFSLSFANGALGFCVLSSVAAGWKGFSIQIYGEKGALFVEGEDKLVMFRKTTATHDLSFIDPLLSEGWISGSIWRASFKRMTDALLENLKNDNFFDGANFFDGVKNSQVIEAIRLSHEEGRKIKC